MLTETELWYIDQYAEEIKNSLPHSMSFWDARNKSYRGLAEKGLSFNSDDLSSYIAENTDREFKDDMGSICLGLYTGCLLELLAEKDPEATVNINGEGGRFHMLFYMGKAPSKLLVNRIKGNFLCTKTKGGNIAIKNCVGNNVGSESGPRQLTIVRHRGDDIAMKCVSDHIIIAHSATSRLGYLVHGGYQSLTNTICHASVADTRDGTLALGNVARPRLQGSQNQLRLRPDLPRHRPQHEESRLDPSR